MNPKSEQARDRTGDRYRSFPYMELLLAITKINLNLKKIWILNFIKRHINKKIKQLGLSTLRIC